jgi:hypothetical protein
MKIFKTKQVGPHLVFMGNFIVSHPASIHVMTHEAKVLIRSSSTLKHNCQVSSAKCYITGNVQAVRIKSDLLILISPCIGWLLLLYSPSWAQCCHHQCPMRKGRWLGKKHFFIGFQFPS